MKDLGTSSSALTAPSNGEQAAEQVRPVLVAARKLIEKPENWTQEEYARDAAGRYTSPLNRGAVCFCMVGACARAAGVEVRNIERDGSFSDVLRSAIGRAPHAFNDEHSHAEVLAAFDKAIASLSHSDDRVPDGNDGAGA